MPFVPLTPEEQEKWAKPICRDREHFPPSHMVIYHPTKYVCPSCGKEYVINPPQTYC